MGIDLVLYRARIGLFTMPRRSKFKLDKLSVSRKTVSMILRLVICLAMLITLGGDIESNPGPPRGLKQKTLSFSEAASSAATTEIQTPPTSQETSRRPTRATKDNEVMTFLRDMKTEVRADLAAINNKVDDTNNTVNMLKAENESLKQENKDIKYQLNKLVSKIDTLEGHSRRNNLRLYGIAGKLGEKWEETEVKVRTFITDTLGLSDIGDVSIERAHRVGSKQSTQCPIIAKFTHYKDRDTILKTSKQIFDRNSAYSVREDYTERVQLHRRELGKRLVEARSNGQYASLRFDKLIIDNDVYKYNDLTKSVVRVGSTQPGQRTLRFGPRDSGAHGNGPRDQSHDHNIIEDSQSGLVSDSESEAVGGTD